MKTKKKPSKKRMNKVLPSRKYVNKILNWCLKTYGKSRYNRWFPEITYRSAKYMDEDPMTMAYYDDHARLIFINKDDHKSLYQLANSIIHEYTHYKQNSHHYQIISQYISYREHPLEIEANAIAKRDTRKCLKEILDK